MKRILRSGRYARYEGGVLHNYRPGDEIELSEGEAELIASLLIAGPAVEKDKPASLDESAAELYVDGHSAYDIIATINALDDLGSVRAIYDAEQSGRGRTTVLNAAKSRILELTPR